MANAHLKSLTILFGVWLVIYFAGIFSPPLLDDVDTVHAEAAREMVLRHDWVTLYANGIRYLEKAPLMYWGVAASYTIFGASDWSTRLPLVLGVLALIFATYALGVRYFGERGGFYSGLVMATALGPYLFTRFLIPDVLVGLFLTLTFLFFLRTLDDDALEGDSAPRWACWGLAAMTALNVLTKGLIGLVFPIGVIGGYLILTGNVKHAWRMRVFSSTLVFLLISVPWHVLAALRNPAQGSVKGFLWFYFVNEHYRRYIGTRVPHDYDKVPLLLFWVLLLLWLFPWIAFFARSLREIPRRWSVLRSRMSPSQRTELLAFTWALVILVFFSFSTRQEYYTIPAIPALALLVGSWLAREEASAPDSADRRSAIRSSLVLFVIGTIGFVVGMFLLLASKAPAPGTDLADLLLKHPQDYALSFGHFFDLTPQALGAFRIPLLGAALSIFLGTGFNWLLRRRNNPRFANWALTLMMVGLFTCVHTAFVTFSPILSSKNLAMAVGREYQAGDTIVVLGKYEDASTLNFYLHVPLRSLHVPTGNMWYGAQFPDAPHIWETQSSFAELWKGSGRVFLWTEQDSPPELAGLTVHEIARSGGKFIYSNR
jgi:4-amino-4-deoxy-L-arabinose transferase-like glycosyltransferase